MANPIDTRAKRERLPHRSDPYWARIEKGAYLGFRTSEKTEGTWLARWRDADGKQQYRPLGTQPNYDAAAALARAWFAQCTGGGAVEVPTVEQVCVAYVEALASEGRKATAADARGRFARLVCGQPFGRIEIDKLKAQHVERWLSDQIDPDDDPDELRRAKDSANRNLASLKAALNRAFRQRVVLSDTAWRTVPAFPKVGARRADAFLSADQRRALLEACAPDLRLLATAALLIGARPGELAKLDARDFDRYANTLTLTGKTGSRTIALSTKAAAFFAKQAKGKLPGAPMLLRDDGLRWTKDTWKDRFVEVRQRAGLSDDVVLYSLRHTAISEMILAGMDSFLVAKLCGTSVPMIESNYGHLRHATVAAVLDRIDIV